MDTTPRLIEREWNRADLPLPEERDFDPWGGSLDAQCAWRNFGGLSRPQAYDRFLENPLHFQEDFMFMGGVAFVYYFPVIERYLLAAQDADEPSEREAWILAHCIKMQLLTSRSQIISLEEPILRLSKFVRGNLTLFGTEEADRDRIDEAWRELQEELATPST